MHIIAAIHNCFGILQIMKHHTKNKTHHQNSSSITKFCQLDFVLKSVVIEGKREFQVEFAFQDIDDLPNGFSYPEGREKPWGTGHAILSAAKLIDGPFNAINADDYYGRESFQTIADFYARGSNVFTLVAFRLENTLSIFGSVTRGLCEVKNDRLTTVIETDNLQKTNSGIASDRDIDLNGSEPVSMNMWGFTPIIFDYLQEMFVDFLAIRGDELKSEFLISLTAGSTSSPISLRLRIWSSWDMAPSPSQKKTLPGLKYSRTSLILGMTVLGVPVMMVLSAT